MSLYSLSRTVLKHVLDNDVKSVETIIKKGDTESLRHVIRHQLSLADVFNNFMKGDALLAKLLQYEIGTMSCLHLASMLGRDDILMAFLDIDVPVDEALTSGTTPLHIASFADQLNTTNLLLTVYKADKLKTDNYGWTALHYASTEGHLNLVRRLVDVGISIMARDQDGTTAAFRAQTNGHTSVVQYLVSKATGPNKTDMLTVPEETNNLDEDEDVVYMQADGFRAPNAPVSPTEPVYAKVNKGKDGKKDLARSLPVRSQNLGKGTIRRLVRKEIERALLDTEYLDPSEVEEFTIGAGNIGLNTMRCIMREELSRVRRKLSTQSSTESETSRDLDSVFIPPYRQEENPYQSIASLPLAPQPPKDTPREPTANKSPPELPPRNSHMLLNALGDEPPRRNNPDLTQALKSVTLTIGNNWKKLALALPIDSSTAKVKERIEAIEKQHPRNTSKQATAALAEWRINKGKEANIEGLVAALRKCGMNDVIPVVERVSHL